jgi:hypothetical protein
MTRRLVLVPASGPRDPLRRYRLARLDEIALGTPTRQQGDEEPKPRRPAITRRAEAGLRLA